MSQILEEENLHFKSAYFRKSIIFLSFRFTIIKSLRKWTLLLSNLYQIKRCKLRSLLSVNNYASCLTLIPYAGHLKGNTEFKRLGLAG